MNKPSVAMIRLVQSQLNLMYKTGLAVDGSLGPATMAALMHVSTISATWTPARRFVGTIQHMCTIAGIDAGPIDGYWGARTQGGYEQLLEWSKTGRVKYWRDADYDSPTPTTTPASTHQWPRGRTQDMNEFFGPVGTNMAKVSVPYKLKLAWDLNKSLTRFTCHKLVVEPIQAAMEEILDVYGLDFIIENQLDHWGGCLNVRKVRGGSNYSMHSWGAAIDWDPTRNRLRWTEDEAELSRPQYESFWQAWERQGAVSLGRTKGYDYMHVQFCTV